MTTTLSLTLRLVKSSVPLNRVAAAMPSKINCVQIWPVHYHCAMNRDIHLPDGLLCQQTNNTFLFCHNLKQFGKFNSLAESNEWCPQSTTTLVLHTMLKVWIQVEPQESHQVLCHIVLSGGDTMLCLFGNKHQKQRTSIKSKGPCLLLNDDQCAECLDPIHHGDMTSP